MTFALRTSLVAATLAVALAGASSATFAADVSRQDILSLFELQQVDKNHDTMVSKKEFMDMMSKAWDMEATQMKVKDKMTLEQYKAFATMFNLNVGS
jgi:hypothetical protein